MATRVVEWKKPYTWWKAISIDENKVISLNLRDENNLIIYDSWDDEIYVDLQLPDWIQPLDAFPVGVTTGRVLVADDWDVTGTIICAKTTSGDNIKLLYGDNGTLWIDNGTGTFKQIYFKSDVDALLLALRNYIDWELSKKQNWVSSDTAPEDPAQWDLWYDSANDRLMIYDWTNWNLVWWGWWGSWDVLWPASATNWHLAVFDWATWKIIKDWWAVPTIPTNVSDFNNDAGYITGITSSDVTTALWYTPYNSSNPAGYITSADIPTNVSDFNNDAGYLTSSTWVTSVNGSHWAVTISLPTTITVTLTTAWWSSNTQTVSATWVTASNTVIVSPDPSDYSDYTDAGIYCSAQWSGTLIFTCGTTPSNDIDVNVVILS